MRGDAVRAAVDAELARVRRLDRAPRVLDVGGGSGVFAVPLAVAGCVVTVVEPSPNALATLHRRADEAGVAGRITAVQGDSDALGQLVPAGDADLVLAHGLLEVVDDPKATVAAMVEATAPGGALSVLVANRFAAVLHRVLSGRLIDARALLADPAGKLPGEWVQRRFDADGLRDLLTDAGAAVELLQGSGVLTDLVPGSVIESTPGASELLAELERLAAVTSPLREIGARLHALGRRTVGAV